MEIFSLLENEIVSRSPYFTGGGFKTKLAWRGMAMRALIAGDLNLRDFFINFLPGIFKSDNAMEKVHGYADHELESLFAKYMKQGDGAALELFGRPFFPHDNTLINWIMAIRLSKEIIIDDQYKIKKFIHEDSIVIDGGANIGAFSVFAAHAAPRGRVYSFEPARSTFQALSRNLEQYENSVLLNQALGDRSGITELAMHASLSVGNTLADSDRVNQIQGEHVGKEQIEIISLDAFMEEQGLDRVDFIKLDVEGYEKKVIEGARELISKHHPTMAISAYHLKGDVEAITSLVKAINPRYRVRLSKGAELDLFFWEK